MTPFVRPGILHLQGAGLLVMHERRGRRILESTQQQATSKQPQKSLIRGMHHAPTPAFVTALI